MIAFCNLWVLFTLCLFYFGPIDWPGAHTPTVAVYVLLCLIAFNAGTKVSRNRPIIRQRSFPFVPDSRAGALVLVGVYSTVGLILVATVTGKSVLSAGNYSLEYGDVYDDYQAAIENAAFPVVVGLLLMAKAVMFPVVLTLFVKRFNTDKIFGLIFLGPMAISSLFRGTDLEIIDIVIIVFATAYLQGMMNRWRLFVAFIVVVGVLELFLARRLSRFGNDLPACLPESQACFDSNGFIARNFGQNAEVLSVFLTNYMTNGYQGLSNAFQLPWNPNWGFGHLPTFGGTVCQYLGTCPSGSYQQELTVSGWDSQNKWTTAYTVIANDFTFLLVPLYLFFLGVVARRCLSAWAATKDPMAGAGLILILVFWIYSSANMHLAITLEWAVATILLLYVAPWRRVDRRQLEASHVRGAPD